MENQKENKPSGNHTLPPENINQPIFPIQPKVLTALTVALGFLIMGISGYFLGLEKGRNEEKNINKMALIENPTPSSSTSKLVSKPKAADLNIAIVPTDWKKYTQTDSDLGLKTTMAMPPSYSFRFTGSEFIIQDDASTEELWGYTTLCEKSESGEITNAYAGGSRRVWFSNYIDQKQPAAKIISVNEKPLNSTSYLLITVESTNYDTNGNKDGTRNENTKFL